MRRAEKKSKSATAAEVDVVVVDSNITCDNEKVKQSHTHTHTYSMSISSHLLRLFQMTKTAEREENEHTQNKQTPEISIARRFFHLVCQLLSIFIRGVLFLFLISYTLVVEIDSKISKRKKQKRNERVKNSFCFRLL